MVWGGDSTHMVRCAQREPADSKLRSGQLSPRSRMMERITYTFSLDQARSTTTSGNALKAVPSRSQTGLSVSVGPTVPMA